MWLSRLWSAGWRQSRALPLLAGLMLGAVHATASPSAVAESSRKSSPRGKLELTVDRSRVDLEAGRLEVKLSRPAAKVKLKVLGAKGQVLAETEKQFQGAVAGTPLVVTWPVHPEEAVARIEIFGYDTEGYYKGVALTPWSLEVPHQDVLFDNDSDQIAAKEEPKLQASLKAIKQLLAKHESLGPITLFVAAHTDCVGSAQYNLELSVRRARAITRWFRAHGLSIPIAYAGLGELAPKVPTEDEVPEARNRRVDYMLALEPPRLKSGGEPAWRRLK